ncbi:MAG TPA: CoA-transferase [Vicinamibacterales bacterium]|nr:CoA-transferase [Vicinamibacterales bacterium]
MMGGFGLCGIPETLIAALRARGTSGLTVISSPVAGLIIWKPTTSVGCRSARP